MSMRTLFILAAAVMALLFVAPVQAAPMSQQLVGEVVVSSSTTFTLTVMIDEVTTVAIPMQVDWLAEGPSAARDDEVTVIASPSVLRTGFFSVTVGAVSPTTGTLAVTLTQAVEEGTAITTTTPATTTTTTPTTDPGTGSATAPITTTAPATGPTVNTEANLRAGPSTEFEIVGSAPVGQVIDVVGQNSDGTWLVLANGAWVAAFLVDNVPAGLPVVEAPAAPEPAAPEPATTEPAAPAPDILTPTATPTATQ